MNCTETRKYLSAFIDNELDTRTNLDVVEHLRMCNGCEARLEELNGLKQGLVSCMKSTKAPQSLRDRIAQEILDPTINKRRVRAILHDFAANGWVRALTAAASILVVFTLVYWVLLRPPAPLNSGVISDHIAVVLKDQVPTFIYTADAERAKKMALFNMRKRPSIPLINKKGFQLVGAGPSEIELRNVGHFVFRYRSEDISMFVFEGLAAADMGGTEVQTRLGAAKIDSRRGLNLIAWDSGGFTYVLVSRMAIKDLLDKVAPAILTK